MPQQRPREHWTGIAVGDHQANGDIESAAKTLKAQMRATRFWTGEQAGQTACARRPYSDVDTDFSK